MEEYLYYIVSLTIDGLTAIYFTAQYLSTRKLLSSYLTSMAKGINYIDNDEKEPQYVVVRGNVKSIGPSIKSLKKSFTSGVIQKLTVKEFVAEKSFCNVWVNHEKIIDEKWNVIPFQLCDGKFKINVTSPLNAQYLDLEIVEDRFEPSVGSLLGLLFGIQQRGIQHTEYLLQENSIITGFGEVIKDSDGSIQLIPPKNGMCYILTMMDPETLTAKLSYEKKYYGLCCIIFSILGVTIAGALAYKLWTSYSRKKKMRKLNEQVKRSQLEHRMNCVFDGPLNENFACIICFVRPREVVLLPCGHISMCATCSSQCRNDLCPVCRQEITDINLIFLS